MNGLIKLFLFFVGMLFIVCIAWLPFVIEWTNEEEAQIQKCVDSGQTYSACYDKINW